ncbi:hypothetical protein ACOBV9_14250 [Pseudoalteromonas espejiana]
MTPFWEDEMPGMKLVREISKQSDPSGKEQRVHHYGSRCLFNVLYERSNGMGKENGGITGENIKKGMYVKKNWVPKGLEGVCLAANWSKDDHRGVNQVNIYKGNYNKGNVTAEKVSVVTLERRDDWLGY